jgi:hypothetical protein
MNPIFSILLLVAVSGCHVHTYSGTAEYNHDYNYPQRRSAAVYYVAPPTIVTCANLSNRQCADRVHNYRRRMHQEHYPRYHKKRGWQAHW